MSGVPSDCRFSDDHQWLRALGDGTYRMGLTDYAQDALGEVTLVRLADAGTTLDAGAEIGEVEAFKAMTDLYMPVTAVVVGMNDRLAAEPTLVNVDPYGDGWLCIVRPDDADEIDALLDADAYRELINA